MKNILLFGAGKSASVLIEYLIENAAENHWHVTVADADKILIEQKTKNHSSSTPMGGDITNEAFRKELINNADLVISMMPPFLHFLIAKDCIEYSKHLLTASYADEQIKLLADEAKEKGILFLCEMGLDPGIDHMSAMQLIDDIKEKGGKITSFKSHCGGLVAPESDNNPWHYKISWNPRNVVLAGKAGAEYKLDGEIVTEKYEALFDAERKITLNDDTIKELSYYPNRNSLPYIELYGLHEAKTFLRTTLRYRDFILGWKHLMSLDLTDEIPAYDSTGLSVGRFFQQHFDKTGHTENLAKEFQENESYTATVINILAETLDPDADDMLIGEDGRLHTKAEKDINSAEMAGLVQTAHDGNMILQQLYFLGLDDDDTLINKGIISPADGLQFAIENKLRLLPGDKDMVVMQHEIEYEINGKTHEAVSSLIVTGKDNVHTAMAKTVGLPLGIAAKLILNGKIQLSGIHLPITKQIYLPVLEELKSNGIIFEEQHH